MNSLFCKTMVALTLWLPLSVSPAAHAADVAATNTAPPSTGRSDQNRNPAVMINSTTRAIIELLKNPSKWHNDKSALLGEIDTLLSPVIAFDLMADKVMGRYRRVISDEHRQRFRKFFRASLLAYYTNVVLSLDLKSVSFKEAPAVKVTEEAAPVTVKVRLYSGQTPLNVSYTTFLGAHGWQVRNVVIESLSIGRLFQREFDASVKKAQKDGMTDRQAIEHTIDQWPSRRKV